MDFVTVWGPVEGVQPGATQTDLAPGLRQPPVWPIAELETWQYEIPASVLAPFPPVTARAPQNPSDEPVSMQQLGNSQNATEFRLPAAPAGIGPGVWIPAGQCVEIAGLSITGGMIYLGTALKARSGGLEPCLIDPTRPLAGNGDYTKCEFAQWVAYRDISKRGRRAYLQWLASGRADRAADIGHVFLYFYGLERRAIVDAAKDRSALADWPIIRAEVARLLGIYGAKSSSFRDYASEFISWLMLGLAPAKLYQLPLPEMAKTYQQVPAYLRLALGRTSKDGVPVPAHLALAWLKHDPNTLLRTPATRCEAQFDALFGNLYQQAFQSGIRIPSAKTKLKFVYRPASPGFHGHNEIKITFADTPDVRVVHGPINKLRGIAESATDELANYSRFVSRYPDAGDVLEAIILLPSSIWPETLLQRFTALALRISAEAGQVLMPLPELVVSLGGKSPLNRERALALARVLESMGIAMEPDILAGAKLPKPDALIVLFSLPIANTLSRDTPAYQAALLTLQLACAVAWADGDFCAREMAYLSSQIQRWNHLTASHQARLQAHLILRRAVPVVLVKLKMRVQPLANPAKESIAAFLSTVAQADGSVSPAEVKLLEKLYKELGLDPKRVFGDLHAASAGTLQIPAQPANSPVSQGFKLDPTRIAALQRDTERVSTLLAEIFSEDVPLAAESVLGELQAVPEPKRPANLLNLDEPHAAFATLLLTRPHWSREALLNLASEHDLMLDGALERLNEAAFDAHDMPFTEGDNPIEVNAELRTKVDA